MTTVCVTGATGYLASHVVQQLLERGYIVHGTVRSISNTEKHRHLLDLPHSGNLKLFEADLLKEGSFTDAIKGCSIVFHTASPYFISGITNAQEQLVEPALKGTLNVLTTCKEAGTVTKVVITSSTAAVSAADTIEAGVVHTEENWNTYSTIENGPYPFSKVQAERRAWKFSEDGAPFSLIVVNPPLIIGPPLQKYEDLNQLNTSNKGIAQIATTIKEGKELENWQYAGMGLSDVRDVAKVRNRNT
jgi:nucleoside-diphosphate-sugar epimerase